MTYLNKDSGSSILLEMEHVSFTKFNAGDNSSIQTNNIGFKDINWRVKQNETWVITGPVGSGKTTLAESILGKYRLQKGKIIIYDPTDPENQKILPGNKIAFLSFQPNSLNLNYKNFYLQQRYNSTESDTGLTVQESLTTSLSAPVSSPEFSRTIANLGLTELLHLQVIKLSNGQTRKMLLARALLQKPSFLILDNPYVGFDAQAREDLNHLLLNLVHNHLPILLITNQNDVPKFATHVLVLNQFKIENSYTLKEFEEHSKKHQVHWQEKDLIQPLQKFFQHENDADFNICVQFENTNITYDQKAVLNNINWTIKKGDKWALSGPNGSGKTTLLSLINGDNPQAFANKITLFDKRKGSGESIWDLKKRIGFVSPELHLYFRRNIKSETVAATGFTDTMYLNRALQPAEEEILSQFFSIYHLDTLRHKPFLELSTGQQRLVLLIRSLLKNPELLIWDEPFQGLSDELISQSQHLLKAYATSGKTIIFVSHHQSEIPAWINKRVYLENGTIKSLIC